MAFFDLEEEAAGDTSVDDAINHRLEMAMCLRSLIGKRLFDQQTEATDAVSKKINDFLKEELKSLLGMGVAPAAAKPSLVASNRKPTTTTSATVAPQPAPESAGAWDDDGVIEVVQTYTSIEGKVYARKVKCNGVLFREQLDAEGAVVARDLVPAPVRSTKGFPPVSAQQFEMMSQMQAIASVDSGANVRAEGSEVALPIGRLIGSFTG